MKRIEGLLTYYVGNEQYSLKVSDAIHLYKDKMGKTCINELFTEDNVELALKSEIKCRKIKGCLHDINLYLENDICIAHADNFSEGFRNLKFFIDIIEQ